MTRGRIHSIESFGTVDGPGLRFVVFTQGCPMRCAYCHNPDTWAMNAGELMDPADIIEQYERNRSFYRNGGITVTGGEPLVQVDFLIDLFTLAKARDIHTCIDTSGIMYHPENKTFMDKLDKLMTLTDLVMLDIKHINPAKHLELTKQPNSGILAFVQYLSDKNIPMWIRHVVVPGITDEEEYLYQLGQFIAPFKNLKVLDILPYHTMGTVKYEKLGMEYPLKDVPTMDKATAIELKKIVIKGIKDKRTELGILQ